MKLVSLTLVISLISGTPGFAPYAAAADAFRKPAAAPNSAGAPGLVPGAAGKTNALVPAVDGLPGANAPAPLQALPNTAAPEQFPAAAPIPDVAPAAIAVGEANDAQGALKAGEALQAEIGEARANGADASPAIEKFYTLSGSRGAGRDDAAVEIPAGAGAQGSGLAPSLPVSPETHPQFFPPRSSRVGIGPIQFVYWNTYYNIMQWFNLNLATDPNRRVSWDKWHETPGLLWLIGKIRFLRSGAVVDSYDYASNDIKPVGPKPKEADEGYMPDGSYASDDENPRMGAENTRFNSNLPNMKVRPDVEKMKPSARDVGKLRWRKLDADGKPIVKRAGILNNLAAWWIQFQFHNFGGNTKRDPITQNPHKMERKPSDNWPEDAATVDRTSKDPSRVTDDGRPTIMNERTQAWIQAQIYGTNKEELAKLRSNIDGKMLLDKNGNLPEDPNKKGVDLSGFTNNYNPGLSFLHWAFVINHNNICDHLKKFNPTWSDDKLFRYARKINVANIALIHTIEWTEDLLQHPTLQKGMHTDWAGLVGIRGKYYLMRVSYRKPWFAKLIKPLTDYDVFWGMPGSRWDHHDGPFQVPKHFRMVYRLHEMVLDEQEIVEPGTDRTIDRVELINFVHNNTRPVVEKYGYDVLAYSFAKKSAGALQLHNFPTTLTQFKNMQNGRLTDLAELDIFRERTDGTGTYNEFRRSVGEPPVKTFMELTGGDKELADEISQVYGGDIDAVDAGIGILAEPKPDGFALGFTQFYQFVLNAPRRVKSNKHLTKYFSHALYTFEGMEWVLHSGGMGGVIARAVKALPHGKDVIESMEGVTRWFAPWPDHEKFPVAMLDKASADSSAILWSNYWTLGFGAWTATAAMLAGFIPPVVALAVYAAVAAPILLYLKRMLAWRFMQKVWQSSNTDRRHSMFPTLFLGEKWAQRSAALGRIGVKAAFIAGGVAAAAAFATGNPLIGVLGALTALSTIRTSRFTAVYENDLSVLKVALQNRLRKGYPVTTDAAALPGDTALEKRYWFLVPPGSDQPVADSPAHSYRALHEHGLTRAQAAISSLRSHFFFGPRTQKGLSLRERWKLGILFNPFAIYLPNLPQAQGSVSTGIYAPIGNKKGLKPGDVDLERFDRLFSTFAPGRDYMTAYDFARMDEHLRWEAAKEGRGNAVTRFLGGLLSKWRAQQLLQLYGDTVANEDKKLVPAISRDMLLRVYQGTAQVDINKERALDGIHPSLRSPSPKHDPALAKILPEGGFKGTTRGQWFNNVMSIQIRKDPKSENGYYAVLSEYWRIPFIPKFLGDRAQITWWIPRMHFYRVEPSGDGRFVMRPSRLSGTGELVTDPKAPVSVLNLDQWGSLDGAVMTRYGKFGRTAEKISFKGKVVSTWEPLVTGKFFLANSWTAYFKKNINTEISPEGVITFDTERFKGSYQMIENGPGIFRFVAVGEGHVGKETVEKMIGVFIDIVNWKPKFTTNELLMINPDDPKDVGFLYERHVK